MRRVTAFALAAGGTLAFGAMVRPRLRGGAITRTLVDQGVKPSGALGWLIAMTMPPLFRSQYVRIAALLDLRPDDEVLDVACGAGVFLHGYAAHVHRIAGLDHSDVQVRFARWQNRERIRSGTAEIVQGDSAALPWADNSFSAVTCNCLGCFAEPLRSLQEMHRVLRPGGRMVLTFDFQRDAEAARRSQAKWGLPAWSEAELRSLLSEAGFPGVSVSRDKAVLFVETVKP